LVGFRVFFLKMFDFLLKGVGPLFPRESGSCEIRFMTTRVIFCFFPLSGTMLAVSAAGLIGSGDWQALDYWFFVRRGLCVTGPDYHLL